jgi:oxaloacetate decarboxylase alpha subunit
VRSEFGYPIMVTPLSQFVGSQAAINVISGERYKQVTDQVINYALGIWGEEGARDMDPNVKQKILDRPRAKELAKWVPPEPTLHEVRQKIGGPGVSDEELLLRWLLHEEEIAAMRAAGPIREYVTAINPLISLIEEMAQRTDLSSIHVEKPDFALTLEKRGS